MRWRVWVAIVALAALLGQNFGAVLDALIYPGYVAEARAILPSNWRDIAGPDAGARLAAIEAAQTPDSRARAEATGALLRLDASGGLVLTVPMGLDSDTLDLATGCFRFARRQVRVIVWHFMISTGCI